MSSASDHPLTSTLAFSAYGVALGLAAYAASKPTPAKTQTNSNGVVKKVTEALDPQKEKFNRHVTLKMERVASVLKVDL